MIPEKTQENPPPPVDGYKWRAIGIVMIGTFMAILDNSIVNVAIPHMMASFGADLDKIKWVATAYMIAYGVVVLASDFLGKRFGQERLYVFALALFTVGSFFCGRAWSIDSMIAFRAFQAIGGGLMLPTGMTIITKAFKPSERGTAFGIFGLVILLAPVLGPTLGGYIVDDYSWNWIFLVNIPVGIAGFLIAISILRFEEPPGVDSFDWVGFIGMGAAVATMAIALSQGERWGWTSAPIVLCFTIAGAGFFAFVVRDLFAKNPIINLALFANVTFSIICVILFLRAVALFGRTLFLSLFMQTLMGYTALSAGIYLIPGAIVAGIGAPIFGRLSDRIGYKFLIIAGSLVTALSMWQYRDLSINSPYSAIFWPMILFGLGMSMVSSPTMTAAMNAVEARYVGMVSILQTVLMQVGGAYGINYLEALIDSRKSFHLVNQVSAFTSSIHNPSHHWAPMVTNITAHTPGGLRAAGMALYQQTTAAAFAYDDAFVILTGLCIITALLAVFIKDRQTRQAGPKEGASLESEIAMEA